MKKYLGIFSAVFALAAISFSCQKAEITDPNAPGTEQTYNKVDVVLTATLESRIGTKVTLDSPNLAWEDQDQIAVFDGKDTAPNVFTYQAPVVEDENTEETNPEEVTPAAVAVKSSVVRLSFPRGTVNIPHPISTPTKLGQTLSLISKVVPITHPAPAWQSAMIARRLPSETGLLITLITCPIVSSSTISAKIYAFAYFPFNSIIASPSFYNIFNIYLIYYVYILIQICN